MNAAPPPDPHAAEKALQRLQQHATKLVEAADALEAAGGIRLAAASWSPKARERGWMLLSEALLALQSAAEDLGGPPRARPKPKGGAK